jgi:alpha-tubulin suppressor-like RCC1 family protein
MNELTPDQVSIKDIKIGSSFSLGLSEDGKVYSWGIDRHGHLGSSEDSKATRIHPTQINFNLLNEEKKVKKLK